MNGARPNPSASEAHPTHAHPAPAHAAPAHPAHPQPAHPQPAQHAGHAPAAPGGPPKIPATPRQAAHAAESDPIELVEELMEDAPPSERKIQYLGITEGGHKRDNWKRPTTVNGTGATRLRSFHGKYSEQGLEYLDGAVNDWLDNHPDIEVKFVTSTVMTFEGKIREPALVLNVWY